MPIISVRTSETLDQFINRTYGTLSATQLRAVRAATLQANPHLSESAPLSPGTVVVVPPRRLDVPPPSARATDSISGDVAKALSAALGTFREELTPHVDSRVEEVAETNRVLKSARFRRAVDSVPASAEFVDGIAKAAKVEQAELTETREILKKELAGLDKELTALFGQLP